MGGERNDEADGSERSGIRGRLNQDVIEECDNKCEGEIEEVGKGCEKRRMPGAVCGMGMYDNQLDTVN